MLGNEFVPLEAELGTCRGHVVDQALEQKLAGVAISNFAAEKDLLAPGPALVFDKRRKPFRRVLGEHVLTPEFAQRLRRKR